MSSNNPVSPSTTHVTPGQDKGGASKHQVDTSHTDKIGRDKAGNDKIGHDKAGNDKIGHDKAGNDKIGHDKTSGGEPQQMPQGSKSVR